MRKGSDDGPPWDAHWDTWPRAQWHRAPPTPSLAPCVRHKEGVRAESGHCTHSHSSAHPASPPTCAGALSHYLVVNVITSIYSAVWLDHDEHWGFSWENCMLERLFYGHLSHQMKPSRHIWCQNTLQIEDKTFRIIEFWFRFVYKLSLSKSEQ